MSDLTLINHDDFNPFFSLSVIIWNSRSLLWFNLSLIQKSISKDNTVHLLFVIRQCELTFIWKIFDWKIDQPSSKYGYDYKL